MKDTLRDRNILISQFLLPLILYPLIVLITSFLFTGQIKRAEESISRIYVFNSESTPILNKLIKEEDSLSQVFPKNPSETLQAGDIELILIIPEGFSEDPECEENYEIKYQYNSTNELSLMARTRIEKILHKYNNILVKNRLKHRGMTITLLNPLQMESETVATTEKEFSSMIGGILPFLIILFTLTGGFLPALDVIVGEKERGTLETLLVSKITKSDIIVGKFLAIWVTSLMSTFLHFFSSTVTFLTLATQITEKLPISVSWTVFITVLFLMIPLSGFVCAVIMCVIMIARSYKEGSNYLSVMTFLMFMPLSIIFSPSLKANYITSLIPIFNISILFRDILRGDFHWGYTLVTFGMTFLFSAIALWAALKLFQKEDILFRETVDIEAPPFMEKKKISSRGRFPTPVGAAVLLCITFVLIFLAGSYLQSRWLIQGIYITQLLFILAPSLTFLTLWKYDIKKVLRLKLFSPATLLLALFLAFSGMIFTIQVSAVQNIFYPFPNAEEILGPLIELLKAKNGILDFIIKFTMIALLPAICEETLFRGVVQSSLEKHGNKISAIIITAILFGIFHMNPYRFLPTMIIGLYLGYLAQKTKSIFPGMIVHAINNGSIYILLYFFEADSTNMEWAFKEGTFLPAEVFIPGLAVFIGCIYLLKKYYSEPEPRILESKRDIEEESREEKEKSEG